MIQKFFSLAPTKLLPLVALCLAAFLFTDCKSEPDSRKQQKAFYVDSNGDLRNNKEELVKKKGQFKMEAGYYVDNAGQKIKRDIDKTKEKINKTVDNTKNKLKEASSDAKDKLKATAGDAKEKLGQAAATTKAAVNKAADRTAESVQANFNKLFNTKAVGTVYPLNEITFDKDSHRITNMSKADVEGLAAALKSHPESRIQVQVHTADADSNAENKKISKLRAEVVKNMMVALGVKKDQISVKGLGLTSEDAKKAVANTVEVVVEK